MVLGFAGVSPAEVLWVHDLHCQDNTVAVAVVRHRVTIRVVKCNHLALLPRHLRYMQYTQDSATLPRCLKTLKSECRTVSPPTVITTPLGTSNPRCITHRKLPSPQWGRSFTPGCSRRNCDLCQINPPACLSEADSRLTKPRHQLLDATTNRSYVMIWTPPTPGSVTRSMTPQVMGV